MSTTKVSITLDEADLAWLQRRAKRIHRGNLSAAFTEAARLVRQQEAMRAFLEHEEVPELSPAELQEIHAEWSGAPRRRSQPPSRKKKAS